MNASDRQLVIDSLHGTANAEEASQLGKKLEESPELRELFLDHLDVQVFLHAEAKAGAFAEDRDAFFGDLENDRQTEPKIVPFLQRRWTRTIIATSAAAACLVLAFAFFSPQPLSAAVALEKMIEAAKSAGDRTYSVSVVRGSTERTVPGGQEVSLEDATVYVRGTNQYVVFQNLTDGTGKRITGFDGTQSWTFTGDNPVYVSDNPDLFRRDLPGGGLDLPFVDLQQKLEELREGYDVKLIENDRRGKLRLRAVKKSREFRGPREVLIRFEQDSGLIRSIEFNRPDRTQRGPRIVHLELINDSPLPPDFFSHSMHHEPDRPVEVETRRRKR
ncbi:MAG: hypothetical protein AAGA58_13750 [Verrucomicrobiota bacterium]